MEINPNTDFWENLAKVAGGGFAGGILLINYYKFKRALEIVQSLACSIVAAVVFAPATNEFLIAHGAFQWREEWITAVSAVWGLAGYAVTAKIIKFIDGFDLRRLFGGKGGD